MRSCFARLLQKGCKGLSVEHTAPLALVVFIDTALNIGIKNSCKSSWESLKSLFYFFFNVYCSEIIPGSRPHSRLRRNRQITALI